MDEKNQKQINDIRCLMGSVKKIIFIYIFFLFFFIYLLIYVLTTSIYQVKLPNNEIEQLTTEVKFRVPVILDSNRFSERVIDNVKKQVTEELAKNYGLSQLWELDLHRGKNNKSEFFVTTEKTEGRPDYMQMMFTNRIEIEMGKNDEETAEKVSRKLLDDVFDLEIREMTQFVSKDKDRRSRIPVISYSPHYNLVISLMLEDGIKADWEIEEVLPMFDQIFESLSFFANFTIITDVQYYSHMSPEIVIHREDSFDSIDSSKLSTFINFSDWNLLNYDMNPTINFLVFFASSNFESRPLIIRKSTTNSFLVPQWGGVYLLNNNISHTDKFSPFLIKKSILLPVVETFTKQLLQILCSYDDKKNFFIVTESLKRITIYKNLSNLIENLKSLIKVIKSSKQISVPKKTKKRFIYCLLSIKKIIVYTNSQCFNVGTKISSNLFVMTNLILYEKKMMQKIYTPNEHKLAVFLPFLSPIGSIIILKGLRDSMKVWLKNF